MEPKGPSHLLLALSEIKNEPFHLTVIGKDHHPTYYESLADSLGLRQRVSFFGSILPLPFMQQADTLVVPSTYDPFANVTLEALALGVFVVSSPFNGGSEILDKENGSLSPTSTTRSSLPSCFGAALIVPRHQNLPPPSALRLPAYSLDNQLSKIMEGTLLDAS